MEFGVVRFNEMKKYIGTISYKTLSLTLKELEADGLVCRKVFPVVPPRVEYSLTPFGRSIMPVLEAMYDWGSAYLARQGVSVNCSMKVLPDGRK